MKYIFENNGSGWKRWSGPWGDASAEEVLVKCQAKYQNREFAAVPQMRVEKTMQVPWDYVLPDYGFVSNLSNQDT